MTNKRFRTPEMIVRYGWLNNPNTQFNSDGVYECALVFTSDEDQSRFLDSMGAQLSSWRDSSEFKAMSTKDQAKFAKFDINSLVKTVPGFTEGKPELECIRMKSKYAPELFDADLQKTDETIWPGARVKVEFKVAARVVTGTPYVTLYVNKVQVLENGRSMSSETVDLGGESGDDDVVEF